METGTKLGHYTIDSFPGKVDHLRETRRGSCFVFLIILLSLNRPAEAQSSTGDPNLIGVELLGRAGIYSVNYERLIARGAGLGAGFAYWGGSTDHAVLVPLYASWTPIGQTHSLYLGTGATVVVTNVTLFGGSRPYDAGGIGHATVGYQFRSRSGLVIRPAANYFFGEGGGVLWPGIMIGGTF